MMEEVIAEDTGDLYLYTPLPGHQLSPILFRRTRTYTTNILIIKQKSRDHVCLIMPGKVSYLKFLTL